MKQIILVAFCVPFLAMSVHADAKDDVPVLIKQLQDKDEIVRLKAAKALGKLGADAKDAVPALTDALKDADEDVRSVAKQALSKIKEAMAESDKDAALTRLLALLKDAKSDDKDVQAKAIGGLAKLLKSDDDIIRLKAVRGLAESGGLARTVVKELEEAARDTEEGVRREARKAIDNIKTAIANDKKAAVQEKLTPLVKDLKDKSPATRQKALDAIAEIGPDAQDASEALLALLTDKIPAIQQAAMDTLEKVNPTIHTPVLTIMVDRSSRNKSLAIAQLAKMGPDAKATVPFLLRFYQFQVTTRDPDTRDTHSYSVGLLNALHSIDPENKDVQNQILTSVGGAIASDYGSEIRSTAISLGAELVKSTKLDSSKLVKPLRLALNDRACRLQAIKALADLGPDAKDALPDLKQLKGDADQSTREAATEAVKKIE